MSVKIEKVMTIKESLAYLDADGAEALFRHTDSGEDEITFMKKDTIKAVIADNHFAAITDDGSSFTLLFDELIHHEYRTASEELRKIILTDRIPKFMKKSLLSALEKRVREWKRSRERKRHAFYEELTA